MTIGDNQPKRRFSSMTEAARQVTDAGPTLDFISSIIAGLALGIGLDWWLSTGPILTVIGIVLGFFSGFVKMWVASASLEQQAQERTRV